MSVTAKPAPYRPEKDIIRPKPSPDPGKCRDLCSRTGAETLAIERMEFWHARGFPEYRAWVEEETIRPKSSKRIWVVRDNTVGGIPPRTKQEAEL